MLYGQITNYLSSKSDQSLIEVLYTWIMIGGSYIGSFLRLYFFVKHFNFDIWRYDPKYLKNNKMSYLLRQSPNIKNKIRKRFNIGTTIIILTMSLYLFSAIITGYIYLKEFNNDDDGAMSLMISIGFNLIAYIFQILPDIIMVFVSRLYFTECHLYIKHYTDHYNVNTNYSLKTSSFYDNIIAFDVHENYLKMHKRINLLCSQINYWVLVFMVDMTFFIWFFISSILYTNYDVTQIPLYVQSIIFFFGAIFQALFMLWPALRMTELFEELKEKINQQIELLLKDKMHLHDEKLLYGITVNGHQYVTRLRENINIYSKQKTCLELLSQLLLTMEDKPCSFQFLGLSLDRYSIRDFVLALFVGKIFSFLGTGLVF